MKKLLFVVAMVSLISISPGLSLAGEHPAGAEHPGGEVVTAKNSTSEEVKKENPKVGTSKAEHPERPKAKTSKAEHPEHPA